MKPEQYPHNRACAAPGLVSFRYRQPYGFVMIGAPDAAGAMAEARRSILSEPDPAKLEVWDGQKYGAYIPV